VFCRGNRASNSPSALLASPFHVPWQHRLRARGGAQEIGLAEADDLDAGVIKPLIDRRGGREEDRPDAAAMKPSALSIATIGLPAVIEAWSAQITTVRGAADVVMGESLGMGARMNALGVKKQLSLNRTPRSTVFFTCSSMASQKSSGNSSISIAVSSCGAVPKFDFVQFYIEIGVFLESAGGGATTIVRHALVTANANGALGDLDVDCRAARAIIGLPPSPPILSAGSVPRDRNLAHCRVGRASTPRSAALVQRPSSAGTQAAAAYGDENRQIQRKMREHVSARRPRFRIRALDRRIARAAPARHQASRRRRKFAHAAKQPLGGRPRSKTRSPAAIQNRAAPVRTRRFWRLTGKESASRPAARRSLAPADSAALRRARRADRGAKVHQRLAKSPGRSRGRKLARMRRDRRPGARQRLGHGEQRATTRSTLPSARRKAD